MKKPLIYGSIIAVVLVTAWFLFFRKKQEPAPDQAAEPGKEPEKPSPVATNVQHIGSNFPLVYLDGYVEGSEKNKLVKKVQEALNRKYNSRLTTDGKFGPLTRTALAKNGFPAVIQLVDYSVITDSPVIINGEPATTQTPGGWQQVLIGGPGGNFFSYIFQKVNSWF